MQKAVLAQERLPRAGQLRPGYRELRVHDLQVETVLKKGTVEVLDRTSSKVSHSSVILWRGATGHPDHNLSSRQRAGCTWDVAGPLHLNLK